MIYLLDANIVRYLVNDAQKAPKIVDHIDLVGHENIVLSAIVAQEIAVAVLNRKLQNAERDALESILHYFALVAFDDRAARHAAYVESELTHTGAKIGKADMLIAGHARGLGMTVVTHNTKDFSKVAGLQLEDWTI